MKKGEHRPELLEALKNVQESQKYIQMSERAVLGVVEDLDDKVSCVVEDAAKTSKTVDAVITGLANVKTMFEDMRKAFMEVEKRIKLLEDVLVKEYPSTPKS
jgi:predicted transcriptional regulator